MELEEKPLKGEDKVKSVAAVNYRKFNDVYATQAQYYPKPFQRLDKYNDEKTGAQTLGENYRDYIIRAELLPVEPMRGDTIQDGSEVYELYSESMAQKCYRYSDPYKQLIRVYTRRLEANAG